MAKRAYENKYPSVTTILGVLRKIALEYWFKVNTLEFINAESNKGKEIGTQIHEVIQSYIETGKAKVDTQYTEEVTNALNSFMLFRKEMPEIILHRSELPLTSEIHKFNGTIDCMGEGILIDWKTGKCKDDEKPKIYDEYLYQVAAYVYLYNEVNKTNIDRALIVAVAKDKVAYNTLEMNKQQIDGCFNEVFLPALRILNFQKRKD
jgi:hypothetical protein